MVSPVARPAIDAFVSRIYPSAQAFVQKHWPGNSGMLKAVIAHAAIRSDYGRDDDTSDVWKLVEKDLSSHPDALKESGPEGYFQTLDDGKNLSVSSSHSAFDRVAPSVDMAASAPPPQQAPDAPRPAVPTPQAPVPPAPPTAPATPPSPDTGRRAIAETPSGAGPASGLQARIPGSAPVVQADRLEPASLGTIEPTRADIAASGVSATGSAIGVRSAAKPLDLPFYANREQPEGGKTPLGVDKFTHNFLLASEVVKPGMNQLQAQNATGEYLVSHGHEPEAVAKLSDSDRSALLEKHAREDTQRLQTSLRAAGETLDKFGVDSKLGDETRAAVIAWKGKNPQKTVAALLDTSQPAQAASTAPATEPPAQKPAAQAAKTTGGQAPAAQAQSPASDDKALADARAAAREAGKAVAGKVGLTAHVGEEKLHPLASARQLSSSEFFALRAHNAELPGASAESTPPISDGRDVTNGQTGQLAKPSNTPAGAAAPIQQRGV